MVKEKKKQNLEIEHPQIQEIEHTTTHPNFDDKLSLYNVNFAPDENRYLNER